MYYGEEIKEEAPRLSIIIPAYNRPTELAKLLISIYNHLYENHQYPFEVIVSDDSDNEEYMNLIYDYCQRMQMSIEYTRNKYDRVGPSANRQNGLDHARGDWVTFIDDDDLFIGIPRIPDQEFDTKISYITTQFTMIDGDTGEPKHYENNSDFLKCLTHGKLYNRRFLVENKISYDVTAPAHEDIYFNLWVISATICSNKWIATMNLDESATFYQFTDNPRSLSHQPDFYNWYITDQPEWFLNKFDKPLDYAIKYPEYAENIYNIIKNEIFYACIMGIMRKPWGVDTPEYRYLYDQFYCKCLIAFRNKINPKEVVNEAMRVMNENKLLLDGPSYIADYFKIISYIFDKQ